MSDITPIRPKIVIEKITRNGPGSGDQLYNCYFLVTDTTGVYNLYNQESNILAANIVSGQNFNFTVEKVHFNIHDFVIDDTFAKGHWSGNPLSNEPEGTFQAGSGPGEEIGDVGEEKVVRPKPLVDPIEIKNVTGGSDKDKLKKCYFMPTGSSKYSFYDKDGNLLASGLTDGKDFSFPHDKVTWKVTKFVISDSAASGDWSNPNNFSDDQEGTFQASSGPGVPVDTATAASA